MLKSPVPLAEDFVFGVTDATFVQGHGRPDCILQLLGQTPDVWPR
jgi:hypothetical protein